MIRKIFVGDSQVLVYTKVMNPNEMTHETVVAILKHIAGTLAKPCTLLDSNGKQGMSWVNGGEIFCERDEFHFLNLCCCLLYVSIIAHW